MNDLFETEIGRYIKISKPFVLSKRPCLIGEILVEFKLPYHAQPALIWCTPSTIYIAIYYFLISRTGFKYISKASGETKTLIHLLKVARQLFHKNNPYFLHGKD